MRLLAFALAFFAFAAPITAAAQQTDTARAAIAAVTAQEWSALEPQALVARVLANTSRTELERLAAEGDARAATIAALGYAYALPGFSLNSREAVRLYQIAAAQGDARAQAHLSDMYYHGIGGLARDEVEALRLARLSADQRNALGQSNLAVFYDHGEAGVQQDLAEAVRLFRLSADQGSGTGAANLGNLYLNGRGVPQDDAEALRWFQRSAELGSYLGTANLAYMYEVGRGGVPANRDEAIRLYRVAAPGDIYAREQLARLGVEN